MERQFRRVALLLPLVLFFPSLVHAQILKDPDVDSICVDHPLTLTFSGSWGSGSRWNLTGGGSTPDNTLQTIVATWSNPGNKTITARVRNGPGPPDVYNESIVIVDQPTGPTLDTQTPAGSPCEGELVSATFDPGSDGIGCTDEFQYSTRTGAVWSAPLPYTPGEKLSTGGIDELIIEGRRAGCDATVGCAGTLWTTLAQWVITPDLTPPVITGCATDRSYNAGPTCQVTVPDLTGEVVATDNCDPSPVITQFPVAGSTIGEGVTTVTLTVTDAGGNTASCTADITVSDITPPMINGCPVDLTTAADTSYCGSPVTWTEPAATDNCPGVVLTSSHSPGDFFPLGTTAVTYTATDGSGNTDHCSFDVTIQPAADPVISGPVTVCTPVRATYSVTDPGSHTFAWTVTNGSIVGPVTGSSIEVDWTGVIQGTVEVTITSGSGCTNQGSITVDQFPTPSTGDIQSNNTLTRR